MVTHRWPIKEDVNMTQQMEIMKVMKMQTNLVIKIY